MICTASKSLVFAVVALACLLGGLPSARAATTTYDTNNTPYTGGTIAPGDTVLLNNGATVTGNVVDNGTLQFNQTGRLTISNVVSGTGAILLTNTGTLNLTNSGTINLGYVVVPGVALDMTTSASAGVLQIMNGSGPLLVGYSGTGTLNVNGGSVTNKDGYLGYNAGSVGTAMVSSGTWVNSGYRFIVGYSGTGTLNVNGGTVAYYDSYTEGYLGYNAGSVGTATISGGIWATTGALFVGYDGTGSLNVTGGLVTDSNGYLGYNAGSVGTATVSSGTWATWANQYAGNLYAGYSGVGRLNVNGGSVTNIDGYLGYNAGSVGTSTVSSGIWANSGKLYVGYSGTGGFNVNGGVVTNTDAYLAYNAGSVGTATVSGGTWANNGNLYVGWSGTGTLNVTGGMVTNATGYVGFGSIGTATVSSGTWANGGNLYVGWGGTGTLNLNGGLVSVAGTLSIYSTINLNSSGTLQIGVGRASGVLDVDALTNNGTVIFNRSDFYDYSGIISGTGALTKLGDGILVLSGNNTYTGLTTISAGSLQTSSIAGNVINNSSLIFSNSNDYTYSGIISGTGAVTKLGNSALVLSGNNTYTGLTTISAGSLQTSSIGGNVVNNAWLIFSNSNTSTCSGNISGTGEVTKTGTGTLTLSGSNEYTGTTYLSGGTLVLGDANALAGGGSIGFYTGELQYSANNTQDYSARIMYSFNSILINTNGQNVTFASGLAASNTGGLTKRGAGTLTLSGSNEYKGTTGLSGGVLSLGNAYALGSSNAIRFRGGVLQYSADNAQDYSAVIVSSTSAIAIDTNGQNVTFATGLASSNRGGLTKLGAGTLTLSGNNSYTGGTTIRSGEVAVTAGGGISHGSANLIIGQSAGDSGTLNVTGGSVTNSYGWLGLDAGSVGTATVSSGTWANSGNLFFGYLGTGTLNVTGGLVTSSSSTLGLFAGSVGTATVSSGTWASSSGLVVGNSGTGTLNVIGGSVNSAAGYLGYNAGSNGTATVLSGTWVNSGDLTVGASGTGTLTMSGGLMTVGGTLSRGTYGTINLNSGGTLQIGVGDTTGVLGVSTLANNGTLIFNRSTDSNFSGIISGTGAVTKQGGGTLTLSGSSSYSGATAVDSGKMLVNGQLGNTAVVVNASGLLGGSGTILGDVTVGSSGTLAPGNSPGVLTVGSLSLMAGSHTAMEITGTSASLYDQVFGTGSGGLTYGGNLDLVMSGSYADQTVFNLFSNFSSYTGNFTSVGLDATGEYSGLTFSDVGGVWTSTETANNQRLVFSTTTGNLSVMAVAVPEPSTCVMAIAGLACGGWRTMRRRRLRQAPTLAA